MEKKKKTIHFTEDIPEPRAIVGKRVPRVLDTAQIRGALSNTGTVEKLIFKHNILLVQKQMKKQTGYKLKQ